MRATISKNSCRVLIAACVSWLAVSCGGASNDQGMSVTFLGLFNSGSLATGGNTGGGAGGVSVGQLGCGQLPAGLSGGYIQLGDRNTQTTPTISEDNASGMDFAGNFLSVIGIQNNLYGQAYRAERLLVDYFIPGASIQPPSFNSAISLIAGPAESASRVGGGSSGSSAADPGLRRPLFTALPPSFSNLCNRALAQVIIIPASIREWLTFNRHQLPSAPYLMEVTIRVAGVASSGDQIETNDATFTFDVLPESFVIPQTPTVSPTAVETGAATGNDSVDDLGVMYQQD
jgi:hypothetical protein